MQFLLPQHCLHSTRQSQNPQTDAISSCIACGMVFGYDVKALQCDRCQAPDTVEMWRMPQFAIRGNIRPLVLVCNLQWFCMARDKSSMEISDKNEGHSPDRLDKFDNHTTLVESLLSKCPLLWRDTKPLSKKLEDFKCRVTEAVKLHVDSR